MYRVYELGDALSYTKLKKAGLKSQLDSPVYVNDSLAAYLHYCDEQQRSVDRFIGIGTIPDECLLNFPIEISEKSQNGRDSAISSNADLTESEHAFSSHNGTRNRESFKLDGQVMALIQPGRDKLVVYVAKKLLFHTFQIDNSV